MLLTVIYLLTGRGLQAGLKVWEKSQWTSYNKSTSRHLVDAWSVGMGKGMQSLIIELVCT